MFHARLHAPSTALVRVDAGRAVTGGVLVARHGPLCAVALAGVLAFGALVPSTRLLADEAPYACAFAALSYDRSPYDCDRYHYPPTMAAFGALSITLVSHQWTWAMLRTLNLLAAIGMVAASVQRLPLPWPVRGMLGALLVAFGEGVREAMQVGNLSPLAAALALAPLLGWSRRPLLSGVMLGISVSIKPMAMLALPLLFLHRPTSGAREARVASLTAGGVVLALWLPWAHWLPLMLASAPRHPLALHNLSLQHVLGLLGLSLSPLVVLGCIALVFAALVRQRRLSLDAFSHVCVAACLLSLPAVWAHTLVLAYPLVAAAMSKALLVTRTPVAAPGPRRLERLAVGAAALWLLQPNAFGDLAALLPVPLAVVFVGVGVALPCALALYLARESRA